MDNDTRIRQGAFYIQICNWFWEEVPYMPGYKAIHAALFFAIFDSINRNFWAENTPIAYDRLINKVRVCKQVYLDGRAWLVENGLIEVVPGQNAYHMATFNLGIEVRNQTAILTANLAAIQTDGATAKRTGKLTQLKTSKHINNNTINNTPALPELNIPFDKFWDLYEKKIGRNEKLEKVWAKLTDEERLTAMEHIPKYKNSQPDKQFRKNPSTYLTNKSFNDEIINSFGKSTNGYQQTGFAGKQAGTSNALDRVSNAVAQLETD